MVNFTKTATAEHKAYTRIDSTVDDVPTWIDLLNDVHGCQFDNLDLYQNHNAPLWYWKSDIAPICITSRFSKVRVY